MSPLFVRVPPEGATKPVQVPAIFIFGVPVGQAAAAGDVWTAIRAAKMAMADAPPIAVSMNPFENCN